MVYAFFEWIGLQNKIPDCDTIFLLILTRFCVWIKALDSDFPYCALDLLLSWYRQDFVCWSNIKKINSVVCWSPEEHVIRNQCGVVLGVFSMEIKNRMRLNWLQQLKLWNYHDIGRTLLGGILSFKQTLQMWFNGWLNPLSGRAWRFNDLFILAGRFSSCLGPVSFTRTYTKGD